MIPYLRNALIYFLAFVCPIFAVGVFLGFIHLSRLMILEAPANQSAPIGLQSAVPHPGHPIALVVLGQAGTQLTDLLASVETLAESGKVDVFTVAETLAPMRTTGGLSVFPDFTFATAPQAGLLVIPAVLDPKEPALAAFVLQRAPRAKLILSQGEGARVLAAMGLLDGKRATSHFLAMDSLKKSSPRVHWLEPAGQWIRDGKFLTSGGIAGSIAAGRAALNQLLAPSSSFSNRMGFIGMGASAASDIPLKRPFSSGERFNLMTTLITRGGYDWGRPSLGVFLYPGMSELGLAAHLETLLRSLSYNVTTVAADPWTQTRHGMRLRATQVLSDNVNIDALLIPPTEGTDLKTMEKTGRLGNWLAVHSVGTFAEGRSQGAPFYQALSFLSQRQGQGIAHRVAQLVEYPGPTPSSEMPDFPLRIWIRALLVGFLGVFIAWMARVRWVKPAPI